LTSRGPTARFIVDDAGSGCNLRLSERPGAWHTPEIVRGKKTNEAPERAGATVQSPELVRAPDNVCIPAALVEHEAERTGSVTAR